MATPLEQDSVKEPASQFDAQKFLERTLPRSPGDTLKIFRMHGRNSFRVNWYNSKASQQGTIPGLNTAYIRESKYLFCRLNAEGQPEITYPTRQ